MSSLTFIDLDGKLMTHKKYVNWEGVRQVEGVEHVTIYDTDSTAFASAHKHPINNHVNIWVDFTIQD